MDATNKIQQQNLTEYIKELSQEQKVQQRTRTRAQQQSSKTQEKDEVKISNQGRKLAEAHGFYRKFLQEKAKEIENRRADKVKELKERLQHKPNSALNAIAKKIAQEYLGL